MGVPGSSKSGDTSGAGVFVITGDDSEPAYQFLRDFDLYDEAEYWYYSNEQRSKFHNCDSKDEFERNYQMENIDWMEDFDLFYLANPDFFDVDGHGDAVPDPVPS